MPTPISTLQRRVDETSAALQSATGSPAVVASVLAEARAAKAALAAEVRRIASDSTERRDSPSPRSTPTDRSTPPSEVSERLTYEKGNGRSYFGDLVKHSMGQDGDGSSIERLRRHAQDVASAPEYRDLSRVDTEGGYFTPPSWLVDQFAPLARAGRPTANVLNSQALPGGVSSIDIPKVATGTSTSIQWDTDHADNAAVSETDLTDTFYTAPVRTIAGQQDVAVQLLEQSPIAFDQVVFGDLLADYATKLNVQVLSGSGSSGQVTGIRSTGSIETVSVTGISALAAWAKVAEAISKVNTLRFLPPQVIIMHPRRWAAFQSAVDLNGRPLAVPEVSNPSNAFAALGPVAAEGVVGSMHGLPVVTDPSIPTNVSSSQDVILVLRSSDLLFYESSIRTRVLPEVGSGTLTTRLQVYGYIAFSGARYPKSIVSIGGAGLVAPAFEVPDES